LGRLAALLHRLIHNPISAAPRPKLFHTFHGHVLHSYFGRIKSVFFICVERFLGHFTDKIIAVSENLRKELIGLKIASPGKIITVALGLELDRYLDIKSDGSVKHGCYTTGIIGRLVPVKNHKMFLQAARKLKDGLASEIPVRFFVVGDGPLRTELETYAKAIGIGPEVVFTGWAKDLKDIYSRLDVVALTSLNEGTPVALIEAQAAARPCVATNVGGVPNVIDDTRSGILVACGDADALAAALLKLFNNPELRRTMGTYGRGMVRDKFSIARLIKDMKALYSS
jgi:glycosyltransferase involved in cell wall biosynthesis